MSLTPAPGADRYPPRMPRGIATPGPLLLLLAAALPAQTGPLLTFIGTADEGVGSDGEHT